MKEVLTFRAVKAVTDTSPSVMLTTFMNGTIEKCLQLERRLHVVSPYTCHLTYLSLHRMSCKDETKCLMKKETKGHIHTTARIVIARRMRMKFSLSWDSYKLAIWQDFLHPQLLKVPFLFLFWSLKNESELVKDVAFFYSTNPSLSQIDIVKDNFWLYVSCQADVVEAFRLKSWLRRTSDMIFVYLLQYINKFSVKYLIIIHIYITERF